MPPATVAYPREHCDLIRDAYTALTQEPWCFTIDQIARLTDWQIWEMYLQPAIDRAEKMRSGSGASDSPHTVSAGPNGYGPKKKPPEPGEPGYQGPDGEPGSEIHRRQCIGAYQQVQGLSLERATAQYERQLAQWKAMQGG